MTLISNKTISHVVSDRLQSMRESGIMLDMTVIVNRERKVRAHKLVLASISVHFQETFSNPENPIDVFEMNDCTLDGVEVLLDYAYGELSADDTRLQNKLLDVIDVARRFEAPGLINFVCENTTAERCLQALQSSQKDLQKSFCEASMKVLFDIWKSKLTFEKWASSSQEANNNNEMVAVSEISNDFTKPMMLLKVESSSESSDSDSSEDSNNCTKPLISSQAGSSSGNSIKKFVMLVTKPCVTISSDSSSSESSSESEDEDTKSKQSNKQQLDKSDIETQKRRLSSEEGFITPKKLRNERNKVGNKSASNEKQIFAIFRFLKVTNKMPSFSVSSSYEYRWLYLTIGTDTDIWIKAFNLPIKQKRPRRVLITFYDTSTGKTLRIEGGDLVRMRNKGGILELRKPFKLLRHLDFYTIMVEYLSFPYFEPVLDKAQIVKNKVTVLVPTPGGDVVFRFSPQAIINNALVEEHSFPRIPKLLFSLTPPEQWDSSGVS